MAEARGLTNETPAQPAHCGTRREGEVCLGYGFYWLEVDGRGAWEFRWSRRFFGFCIEDAPAREIALWFFAP